MSSSWSRVVRSTCSRKWITQSCNSGLIKYSTREMCLQSRAWVKGLSCICTGQRLRWLHGARLWVLVWGKDLNAWVEQGLKCLWRVKLWELARDMIRLEMLVQGKALTACTRQGVRLNLMAGFENLRIEMGSRVENILSGVCQNLRKGFAYYWIWSD